MLQTATTKYTGKCRLRKFRENCWNIMFGTFNSKYSFKIFNNCTRSWLFRLQTAYTCSSTKRKFESGNLWTTADWLLICVCSTLRTQGTCISLMSALLSRPLEKDLMVIRLWDLPQLKCSIYAVNLLHCIFRINHLNIIDRQSNGLELL